MAKISLYLDARQVKKSGEAPLKIMLQWRGEQRLIATGVDVPPEHWVAEAEYVDRACPGARRLNADIGRIMADAEDGLRELTRTRTPMPVRKAAEALRRYINGDPLWPSPEFWPVAKEVIAGHKPQTAALYEATLRRIVAYTSSAGYRGSTAERLTFDDMTPAWLTSFDRWMATTAPSANARGIHLRNIRAVFNAAIREEIIPPTVYPFRRFRIRTQDTPKRSLSVEQLRELIARPVEEHQEQYRDIFVLMFMLCGINMVDLAHLRGITPAGRVEYMRAKTGRAYSIKVEPEAQAIIDKYRGESWLVDIMDRYNDHRNYVHRLNRELQRIGTMVRRGRGGKKIIEPAYPGLTGYWARHTWATIAAELDIPDAVIGQALGHSAGTVTDIYIKRNPRKVDEANRRVLDYVLYNKVD